jgi:hypothetical protein
MSTPLLYRQLQQQLSQFIQPMDKRHLSVFSENVAAILLSESAYLSRWIRISKIINLLVLSDPILVYEALKL